MRTNVRNHALRTQTWRGGCGPAEVLRGLLRPLAFPKRARGQRGGFARTRVRATPAALPPCGSGAARDRTRPGVWLRHTLQGVHPPPVGREKDGNTLLQTAQVLHDLSSSRVPATRAGPVAGTAFGDAGSPVPTPVSGSISWRSRSTGVTVQYFVFWQRKGSTW